jgi:hypothetical protein
MAKISLRDLAIGFALGAAAASLLPVFLPDARGRKRELLKSALKETMRAVEGGAERLAEFRENVEDLLAEVSSEMAEETETKHAARAANEGSQPS